MVLKGDLPIEITWRHNNHSIQDGMDGVKIQSMSPRISTLSVDSVNAIHRGVFECVAMNLAGRAEFSTELRVNGIILFLSNILFCLVLLSF